MPVLQKALAIDAEYVEGQRLLGTALNQLERYHEATGPLGKAVELDGNDCEALYRLGEAHYGMGNSAKPLTTAGAPRVAKPTNRAAEVLLGDAHFQLGQLQEARRWYNLAVKDSRYKDYAASKLARN